MRLLSATSALFALLMAFPPSAIAQERVPAAVTTAAGFDIGVFIPRSNELSNSLLLNGNYEYYITPRVSGRAGVGLVESRIRYRGRRLTQADAHNVRRELQLALTVGMKTYF